MTGLNSIWAVLSVGMLLGLSAGFSPGPLMTLVLAQTLKHDKKEGIKVAVSPLLTDFPIILLTLLIFKGLSDFDFIIAAISLTGGAYVAYLGFESFKVKELSVQEERSRTDSIKKGIITNLLSPNPYVFWLTVGGPLIYQAFEMGAGALVLFLASFYICLIGAKTLIAVIVGKSKIFIGKKTYGLLIRILGAALLIFAGMLFYDGIKRFI